MSAARGLRNAELKPALVCFAMQEEAGAFEKLRGAAVLEILVTGIGKENSRRALLAELERRTPAFVLTCGFAGGLNPALAVGDVLFATDDPSLRAKLTATAARPARFFCATAIATKAAEKLELRRATNADAVEMESEVIHEICRGRGIPCGTVRAISDPAGESLPLDFNQLSKPDQSLDFGKLAWAIAKSPGKISALLRLQRQSKLAAQRLAEVLRAVTTPG